MTVADMCLVLRLSDGEAKLQIKSDNFPIQLTPDFRSYVV